jgi:hydroxymethylpyrimidine pyrophosphatase-like HAD family hydrolase
MNSEVFYTERFKRNPLNHLWKLKKFFKIKPKKQSLTDFQKKYHTFDYQFDRLKQETCPNKWKWLSQFCNETNTKICISSVWRNHFGTENETKIEWWNDALIKLGFNPDIFIGITKNGGSCRGEEIQDFLDKHPHSDYAILDDDSDMLEHQFDKFHHCDRYFGMSPNHLYRIQRQFEKKTNYEHLNKTTR